MNARSCFKVAFIMRTHGLKGEVTLTLLPDCPQLNDRDTVFLEIRSQLVPYLIQSVSTKGTRAYLKLEGVNSVDAAAALRGCSVYLPKNLRPNLPKGEFYSDEVIGFEVMDKNSGSLGTVHELIEVGPHRHLVILRAGREILIPINGPFVKRVDAAKKQILVDLPDGLLQL